MKKRVSSQKTGVIGVRCCILVIPAPVELGGAGDQSQCWLLGEFETSLDDVRFSLKSSLLKEQVVVPILRTTGAQQDDPLKVD